MLFTLFDALPQFIKLRIALVVIKCTSTPITLQQFVRLRILRVPYHPSIVKMLAEGKVTEEQLVTSIQKGVLQPRLVTTSNTICVI